MDTPKMDNLIQERGEIVRKILLSKKEKSPYLSTSQLAKEWNVSQATLSRIENGHDNVSFDQFFKIMQASGNLDVFVKQLEKMDPTISNKLKDDYKHNLTHTFISEEKSKFFSDKDFFKIAITASNKNISVTRQFIKDEFGNQGIKKLDILIPNPFEDGKNCCTFQSLEELSDIDEDNLSITDFEDKPGSLYYIKCEKMPVSLSLMEKLDHTLDNMLDNDYTMSETEWFGMFFQVAIGLAVEQKYFNFVHNDLHSSNVMFKKTLLKYLYFQVNNQYYRIPTYGKITKIIDFARGTFKLGDRWIFSDQFKEDGDAHGQYDYPVDGSLKNCEHKPNPSFDLVRLGTTVIQRLEDLPKVREFVEQITLNDYDNSVCYDEDTFDLYIDIARNCHNAVPLEVMKRKEFEKFKIQKND